MNHNFNSRADKILLNRFLWFPIFLLVMMGMYFIGVRIVGELLVAPIDTFLNEFVLTSISDFLVQNGFDGFLSNLFVNGIIAGLFAVFLFLPNIMVIFFIISLLDSCGYMDRVTYCFGRVFNKLGLDGRSSISFILGSGCSVAGMIAAQTIENEYDRRMTIALSSFVPCKGNLPVIVVFVSAFFPTALWAAPVIYLIGIGAVVLSAFLGKIFIRKDKHIANFAMKEKAIQAPDFTNAASITIKRTVSFIKSAGVTIIIASSIIWFLSSYNIHLQQVAIDDSLLGSIGSFLAPIFAPLGFGTWEATVAVISGLAAKEVTVSTLAVLYAPMGGDFTSQLQANFTAASALSFVVFSLLSTPCVAAVSTMHAQLGSWKWTIGAMAYQLGLAYVVSFIVYQIASLIL